MFRLGTFYIGFILLNMLILWSSLYLLEKIAEKYLVPSPASKIAVFCLYIFIGSNPVTKTFFWTVHQQMFTLFTPMLCVYLLTKFRKSIQIHYLKKVAWLFFGGGMLLLVYGSFLMLLPTLMFCLYAGYLSLSRPFKGKHQLLVTVFMLVLFFLPNCCWFLFLKFI